MDQSKTIKAKPGHINIVDEVLTLEGEWVALFVVSTDCQHFAASTLNGDNVWASNLIVVINAFNKKVSVNFINRVPIIVRQRIATFFGFFLFNISVVRFWLPKVYITVESGGL